MDNTYCCVPQCKSLGCDIPRTSFHRFPSKKEEIRRLQWITKLRIGKEVSDRMIVCGKHFKGSDFFPTTYGNSNKKKRLKKNAIPSRNLPTTPEYMDGNENKSTSSKKISVGKEGQTPLTQNKKETNSILHKKDSNVCIEGVRDSIDGYKEEPMNTTPNVIQLSVMINSKSNLIADSFEYSPDNSIVKCGENYSSSISKLSTQISEAISSSANDTVTFDVGTVKISENASKNMTNSTVPTITVKGKEVIDADYSSFCSSPLDSKETLVRKLGTMFAVNMILQKQARHYKRKCAVYKKEVNTLKGVIDNLKLINSVTGDN